MDLIQLDGLYETDRNLKLENIQINHNHIGRTSDRFIINNETIKSATLILLTKVGLGRTFDRSRFWRYPEIFALWFSS